MALYRKTKIIAISAVSALAIMLALVLMANVSAEPTITLSFNRDNGYSNGADINGLFTARATVSSDVVRVEFYLNGTLQSNTTSPYSWSFDTTAYPLGTYTIRAVAYDTNGAQTVAERTVNFVETPSWISYLPFIIILLVVPIVILSVLSLRKRNNSSACPKCGNNAPQILPVNLGALHLKRCSNCGKLYFRGKPYNPSENDDSPPPKSPSDEDRLRKDIDNSKYEK
jgi:hypothetical protein